MTPQEYVDFHGHKPLTPNELNIGKTRLNIFNTDTPMPWDEVYTRIAAGMGMEHIAHIYGQGRKIALWAIKDGITPNDTMSQLLDDEIEQRRKMQAVEIQNPVAAHTLKEMANEYAPDAAKNIATFSNELVVRAKNKLQEQRITSLDLVNLAKAVQTASDILGHTQRHANAASLTHNEIMVQGFDFQLDAPQDTTVIEAETTDG
jgi:hypothetical protein